MILQLIISYLTVVLTLAVQVLSFKKLISEKLNITPLKVVIILIFSLLVILNNLLIPGPFKGLVTILLLYCLSKIWFKKSNKVTLYYTIILAIISLLLDLFISLVILSPKYSGVNEINKDFLPKSAITMIMNICMYFIVCIPKFKMIINKFEELILNKKRYDLLFMVALIIVNLITSIYIKDYANYEIFLAFIVIIIFISILIYNLLKSVFQQDKLQIKFDYLQENIKNYEDIADDYSELKHNLNHDLLAIKSVAGTNKANKLIDEIINKYNKNYHWITRVGNIPKGIQGILYIKLYETEN